MDGNNNGCLKKVCENSILLGHRLGVQGLKPSIYKAFSARLEVVP
jgi:hypothetical protein